LNKNILNVPAHRSPTIISEVLRWFWSPKKKKKNKKK